jgi:hypothetical protein
MPPKLPPLAIRVPPLKLRLTEGLPPIRTPLEPEPPKLPEIRGALDPRGAEPKLELRGAFPIRTPLDAGALIERGAPPMVAVRGVPPIRTLLDIGLLTARGAPPTLELRGTLPFRTPLDVGVLPTRTPLDVGAPAVRLLPLNVEFIGVVPVLAVLLPIRAAPLFMRAELSGAARGDIAREEFHVLAVAVAPDFHAKLELWQYG